MCGLLAFVAAPVAAGGPGIDAAAADGAVARSLRLMRHRGPDEPGTWTDPGAEGSQGGAVFGFNRLSIIDIAHSHQPLRWGPPEAPGLSLIHI